jgi:hypothetical protein
MAKKTMMCRTCKKPKKGCGCKRASGVRAPYRCKICHQLKKSCVCKKAAWRVGDDVRQKARACRTCGKMGHDTRNCPEKPCEKTRTCKACGKMGHDTRNCPTIPRRNKQDDKILQRQLNIHPLFQELPMSSSASGHLRGQLYMQGWTNASVQAVPKIERFYRPLHSGFFPSKQKLLPPRGGSFGRRLRTITVQRNSQYHTQRLSIAARLAEDRRSDYGTHHGPRNCKCNVRTVLMNALAQHFPNDYAKTRECFFCRVRNDRRVHVPGAGFATAGTVKLCEAFPERYFT